MKKLSISFSMVIETMEFLLLFSAGLSLFTIGAVIGWIFD